MQVAQLRGDVPKIHALGAELVLLGNGSVEEARGFRDAERVEVPLYTDPTLASFKGFELERGLGSTLSPMAAIRAVKATAQGYRQTGVHGDPLQQGGAFVIGRDGALALAHVSKSPGDHARPKALLAALEQLVAGAQVPGI
jgi:peroxiredoxin